MIKQVAKILSLFVIAGLVVVSGCGWGEKKKDAQASSVAPSSKIRVINVLEKNYFDDAHIAGSEHVPLADLKKVSQSWDKEVPVVVYCSNYRCSASSGGARVLKEAGFKEVYAYEGGMALWYQLAQKDPSYKFEGPAREEYLLTVVPEIPSQDPTVSVITAEQLKGRLAQ